MFLVWPWCRVVGFGFQGFRLFRVVAFGFWGLGFQGLFWVVGFGFCVQGLGFRIVFGCRVWVQGSGFGGLGLRI